MAFAESYMRLISQIFATSMANKQTYKTKAERSLADEMDPRMIHAPEPIRV